MIHRRVFSSQVALDILDLPVDLMVSYGLLEPGSMRERFWRARERVAYGTSTCLIAGNADIARSLAATGVPPSKLVVAPRGSDSGHFDPARWDRMSQRQKMNIDPGATVLGWFGIMSPHKALVEQLVPALKAIAEEKPGVVILVAGAGKERERLLRAISASGIDTRAYDYVDYRDVPGLFAASDVVLVPLVPEGLQAKVSVSTKIYDAMSMGVPVVAARTRAVERLLGGEDVLALAEAGDPDSMARQTLRVLVDPKKMRKMARRGREVVLSRLDLESNSDRIAGALRACVRGNWAPIPVEENLMEDLEHDRGP
jgi:glycosyltransferase involved in cell wall biosynthesis